MLTNANDLNTSSLTTSAPLSDYKETEGYKNFIHDRVRQEHIDNKLAHTNLSTLFYSTVEDFNTRVKKDENSTSSFPQASETSINFSSQFFKKINTLVSNYTKDPLQDTLLHLIVVLIQAEELLFDEKYKLIGTAISCVPSKGLLNTTNKLRSRLESDYRSVSSSIKAGPSGIDNVDNSSSDFTTTIADRSKTTHNPYVKQILEYLSHYLLTIYPSQNINLNSSPTKDNTQNNPLATAHTAITPLVNLLMLIATLEIDDIARRFALNTTLEAAKTYFLDSETPTEKQNTAIVILLKVLSLPDLDLFYNSVLVKRIEAPKQSHEEILAPTSKTPNKKSQTISNGHKPKVPSKQPSKSATLPNDTFSAKLKQQIFDVSVNIAHKTETLTVESHIIKDNQESQVQSQEEAQEIESKKQKELKQQEIQKQEQLQQKRDAIIQAQQGLDKIKPTLTSLDQTAIELLNTLQTITAENQAWHQLIAEQYSALGIAQIANNTFQTVFSAFDENFTQSIKQHHKTVTQFVANMLIPTETQLAQYDLGELNKIHQKIVEDEQRIAALSDTSGIFINILKGKITEQEQLLDEKLNVAKEQKTAIEQHQEAIKQQYAQQKQVLLNNYKQQQEQTPSNITHAAMINFLYKNFNSTEIAASKIAQTLGEILQAFTFIETEATNIYSKSYGAKATDHLANLAKTKGQKYNSKNYKYSQYHSVVQKIGSSWYAPLVPTFAESTLHSIGFPLTNVNQKNQSLQLFALMRYNENINSICQTIINNLSQRTTSHNNYQNFMFTAVQQLEDMQKHIDEFVNSRMFISTEIDQHVLELKQGIQFVRNTLQSLPQRYMQKEYGQKEIEVNRQFNDDIAVALAPCEAWEKQQDVLLQGNYASRLLGQQKHRQQLEISAAVVQGATVHGFCPLPRPENNASPMVSNPIEPKRDETTQFTL